MTRWRLAAAVAAVLVAIATPAAAHIPQNRGWSDPHVGWPPVPSGYGQIVSVFGGACNAASDDNLYYWYAYSADKYYAVRFHRRLGTAGDSHNLNDNIAGHFHYTAAHHDVKHGIWGYACRAIKGSKKWSTHAWGIAVDQNAAYEPTRSPCKPRTITQRQVDIFESHNWTWGYRFCDPMHFQYATNY